MGLRVSAYSNLFFMYPIPILSPIPSLFEIGRIFYLLVSNHFYILLCISLLIEKMAIVTMEKT